MTGDPRVQGEQGQRTKPHPVVVVMGVSAAGKSAVGSALAERLDVPFIDGDDLHPDANLAKMAAGEALTDADRWPWLAEVANNLARVGNDVGVVIACSALRRSYRDRLRQTAPETAFVHLSGAVDLLAERAAGRTGHFMPPSLLASQLTTLEPLERDEAGVVLDVGTSIHELARAAEEWVRRMYVNEALAGAGTKGEIL